MVVVDVLFGCVKGVVKCFMAAMCSLMLWYEENVARYVVNSIKLNSDMGNMVKFL